MGVSPPVASLKNAHDYFFHEWNGKPAGIVSYGSDGGGYGGGMAAEHLRSVLGEWGMEMVCELDRGFYGQSLVTTVYRVVMLYLVNPPFRLDSGEGIHMPRLPVMYLV